MRTRGRVSVRGCGTTDVVGRAGVTATELMVVIAIGGLASAIGLPVVMKAWEAVKRSQCASNLRQIAAAAEQFHDTKNELPPAVQLFKAPANGTRDSVSVYRGGSNALVGPNWAVFLLAYLEKEAVFNSVDVAGYMKKGDQSWRKVRSAVIPSLVCPADSGHSVGFNLPDSVTTQVDLDRNGSWGRGNYAANAGPGFFHFTQHGRSSRPNLGGVMGINWGATFPQLAREDGASNTILFNELRVGIEARDRRGTWAMGLAGSSVTAANATVGDCPRPNDHTPLSDDVEDCQLYWYPALGPRDSMGCSRDNPPHNWPNWQAQARSRHTGGVNACFADGSVRFIRNTVASKVWELMLSRNDGSPYDYDF